jgi:primosomal protein N' (replication factor Y)
VGRRVLVPLQNRLVTGFILGPEPNPPQGMALREVHRAVDEGPLFPAELLPFFHWLADYYRHPLGQVLATALPVVDPDKPLRPRLEKAARSRPADPTKPMPRLGSAQKQLFDYLQGKDWVPFRVLRQLVAGADGAGRSLAAKGLIEVRLSEIGLCPFPLAGVTGPAPELTAEQAQAWAELEPALAQGGFTPFLLHGVTGSGKTELYLRAGQAVLAAGKTALILVPEIALTPALTARFQGRFGDRVAVLHSGLTPAERRGEWLRLLEGRARVALGARSAVFAPLTDLGLIVVDEEHEPSYKQEDGLRYQARDAALVRGRMAGATVLLGSATPAVVSFHHRRQGKYRGLSLTGRVLARPMPTVEVVDLRQEPETPGHGLTCLSRRLVEATRETLEAGQQVLYFLNRRGFASYPVCAKCGRPLTCPHCSVTLTYHAAFGALVCHYCGLAKGLGRCERCGQEKVKLLGLGTERVQAEEIGRAHV